MSCTQISMEAFVSGNYVVPSDEVKTVTLLKTAALHVIQSNPCEAPMSVCVNRVVKCQKGCNFDKFTHDFPINPCDPILPPGEYEFSIAPGYVPVDGDFTLPVTVVLEDVSPEYVQAILANKLGGCA